ncbi:hypothetical protein Tco_0982301, partial [Tanacetum coccineum]
TMFLSIDQLEKQLDKEEFQEIRSMATFRVLETQFQKFIKSRISLNDEDGLMARKMNERHMQTTEEKVYTSKSLDASLVDIKSGRTESEKQETSSRSGNDAHVDDAKIRPIYDEEPMVEVQLTADNNVFATRQQHIEQPEFNNEGEVDQNAKQCHGKRPLPAQVTDNQIIELSNQSLESENIYLWHVITNGDFQPIIQIPETKLDEVVPFEKQTDDLKRKLGKNNEAKIVIYNVLPRKEYERIFMCNIAKEIWKTLLITHQGNSQVKDNKIDLFVQQHEQFVISKDESVDNAFARFNTIITSLKALDKGYSSKNYIRKLNGNLKSKERSYKTKLLKYVKAKVERNSALALKAKKNLVMKRVSTSVLRRHEEYNACAEKDFKKFFKRN